MILEEALYLAKKIASDNYSRQELDQFLTYMDNADTGEIDLILNAYREALDKQGGYSSYVNTDFIHRLNALRPGTESVASEIPVIRERTRRSWVRWAAAAVILVTAGGLYFRHQNKNEKPDTLSAIPVAGDIKAPQSNRATITLARGQKVFLDSAANGQLAMQGQVRLVKMAEGKIGYEGAAPAGQPGEVVYNTVTNPRGSKVVNITLADGSRVWLNAGSSLTYPVAFTGKERNVQFTGETYFEISPDASKPFTVTRRGDNIRIKVLGTRFNVNAYDDEMALKVTLLEGSVRVDKGKNTSLLKPGQQVQVKEDRNRVIDDIDIDEVMAWKNEKFRFSEKTDIEMIMRQIARWYDLDIEYQGKVNEHFWGSISRTVNASQVFKMLQATGFVKFRIEGRKVTVMPASP
ncbi:MAG: FecR domain-containing protein [Chitinophagaceae bacterium]|nr:FecR domain-containing protein [Chitinophagaceae bacterium]